MVDSESLLLGQTAELDSHPGWRAMKKWKEMQKLNYTTIGFPEMECPHSIFLLDNMTQNTEGY
jgi:hypothetical protein